MNETLSGPASELMRKIDDRTARIGVIGMGYVGLPLAVEFAKAGYKTTGFDVDERKISAILKGESYVADVASAELKPQVKEGRLSAAAPGDLLGECDCISICVPTPLRKSRDPDVSYILSAATEIAKRARNGQLITLESTTYPGTTTEIILPPMEERGLKPGVDFFLAFSPERVDPGNAKFKTKNTPKVIGGMTPACNALATALYANAVDRIVPVSSPAAAEMVKLLENTFRSVNIGLVNEMAVMCKKLGVDVWEVIDAAATKPFGFMPFYPGPGLGGHCIPIDPLYLSWKLKSLNYNAKFI
jgi:UDP-N-acetyl-D-glucosamine dehydrogenase